MALDQTANFLRATLSSAISSGDTTFDLSDSGQLVDPSNGEYNLVVWDPSSYPRPGQDPTVEIVRARALDSGANTLTVNRGQEGTSAAAHPVDAVLQLSPTAKMFSDIDSKTSALSADGQTFAGDAIDVESASVGGVSSNVLLSDGEQKLTYKSFNSDIGIYEAESRHNADTSSTTIFDFGELDPSNTTDVRTFEATVHGFIEGYFIDKIVATAGVEVSVIGSATRDGPAARTYSSDITNKTLDISVSSGSGRVLSTAVVYVD